MSVTTIRTTYLNGFLRRTDTDSRPWSAAECDQHIVNALSQLWGDRIGMPVTGSVAPSGTGVIYTIPGGIVLVSRIELWVTVSGVTTRADRVNDWRQVDGTSVIIQPVLAAQTGVLLQFWGYKPFLTDATDLDARLENVVAMKAAALAWGAAGSEIANAERRQNLDDSRVVSMAEALSMSAYWQRRYEDTIRQEPLYRVSVGPRKARR